MFNFLKFLIYYDNRPSMAKLWTNIANGMATYIVWKHVDTIDTNMLILYITVVGGYELGKRLVDAKMIQMGATVNNTVTAP